MCRKLSVIQQFFLHVKQEKSLVPGKKLCYIEKSGAKLIYEKGCGSLWCDLIRK